MTSLRSLLVLWLLALISPFFALGAQERGAVALAEALRGLDVGARVLVIAAHPDDEDTRLIAWLARGRQVETAYLSLTRGDGGQNLIGNELGEALGVIRSEELLTARTIDGGRQFFTRAFDFGYSKSAEESFRHWPREELLRDVVTVVRAFRPHVIVSIFSGTPRDGHGQHQVAGMLAREAYDIAGDGTRFPAAATAGHAPWTPLKFYRSSNFARDQATLAFNVGEYSHLIGRSFAEIAGESRSQHKSQGFGVLQRRGVVMGYVRREHSRAPAPEDPTAERSVLDGIGTLPTMLRALITGRDMLPQLVALEQALTAASDSADPLRPATAIEPLYRLRQAVASLATRAQRPAAVRDPAAGAEAMTLLRKLDARAERAMLLALGAAAEPVAPNALLAEGDTAGIEVAIYNRGPVSFTVDSIVVTGESVSRAVTVPRTLLLSDSAVTVRLIARGSRVSQPWWLATPRSGGMFTPAIDGRPEGDRPIAEARIYVSVRNQTYALSEPVVFRFADPVRGDVQRALAVVPAIDLTLDRAIEYLPAGERVQRTVGVRVRSASVQPREVRVRAELPRGLRADTMTHVVTLQPFESRVLTFRVEGTASPGRDSIRVLAESGGRQFATGYTALDYEHIRSRQLHRPSTLEVEAVPVVVPSGLRVAYVRGVGDNGLAALEQLGVSVVALDPSDIPATDLSRFTTIVVGPRAYAAHQDLVRHNALLLAFVRRGGTMVVQYGQYEMMRAGIMPFPVSIRRPHDRVTDERAPVSVLQPGHRLLRAPNVIGNADFNGWVQERALYMPAEFDQAYTNLLAMNDPGEEAKGGALLVAPYGEGTYVYTTLAFFRQLPAGVPGAARLFVNLLVPDQRAAAQRVAP